LLVKISLNNTVQEKNITYPTDDKNYKKVIKNCWKIADEEGRQKTKAGNVNAAMSKAKKTIAVDFNFPYLAHAAMEPLNCTAKIDGNKCGI